MRNFQLIRSNDLFAEKIKKENVKSIQKIEKDLRDIIYSLSETEQKIDQIAKILVEGQNETQDLVKRKFTGLGLQNVDLFN